MEDYKSIIQQMKQHKMPIPSERIHIAIPEAKTILDNCFKYFLSLQGVEYQAQKEYQEVANWLEDNEGRGLFLMGDYGRGKSMLTRFVLPAILLKYRKKVVKVYDVHTMNQKLDEVLKQTLIGLDDIGTEEIINNFGNKRLAFAEIMDNAEKYGKLVIISTNLKGEDVQRIYGDRIVDRIVSTTKRIHFEGDSLRK